MKKINFLFILFCLPVMVLAQNKGSVNPSSGISGQTLDVTITGKRTHFLPATGTTFVTFNGGGIVNDTIINDSLLKATLKIVKTTTSGTYEIVVSNSMEYAKYNFNVDGTYASRLSRVNPSSGNAGETLDVTITGVNTSFTKNQNYAKFSFGMGTSTVTVIDDTTLKANVSIPSKILAGDYDVHVDNAIDGSMDLPWAFHVNSDFKSPSLSGMSPLSGYPGQTLDVTITGVNTHFATNNNTKLNFSFSGASGTTVDVNSLTVLAPTSLNASITINKKDIAGDAFYVSVANDEDGTMALPYKFTVGSKPPCNAYYTTAYDSINNLFTLELDSATTTASTFHWDFGDGQTSTAQTPSHSFAKDTLYNVCLRVVTANGDSCEYCHVIGKDSLGNIVRRTQGFNMVVVPSKLVTSVPTINDEISILAFPNPANEVVTISTTGLKNTETTTAYIYSVDGRLLRQQVLIRDKTEIDIHALSKGIYLMQVRNNGQSKIIKFVKE